MTYSLIPEVTKYQTFTLIIYHCMFLYPDRVVCPGLEMKIKSISSLMTAPQKCQIFTTYGVKIFQTLWSVLKLLPKLRPLYRCFCVWCQILPWQVRSFLVFFFVGFNNIRDSHVKQNRNTQTNFPKGHWRQSVSYICVLHNAISKYHFLWVWSTNAGRGPAHFSSAWLLHDILIALGAFRFVLTLYSPNIVSTRYALNCFEQIWICICVLHHSVTLKCKL